MTSYGFSDPIKDMIRPDYKEPVEKSPINFEEVKRRSGQMFSDSVKELDCYLGNVDGYAYGSWDRLSRMRRKYVIKPVGPGDMYLYPGTSSMKCGWWMCDPDLKDGWYKPRMVYGVTTSEMSRYLNYCMSIDRSFR